MGNVDPEILIKKLSKAGKQAQVWSQFGNESAGLGEREEAPKADQKGNPENGNEKAKYPEYSCKATDESTSKKEMANGFSKETSTKASNLAKDQGSITKNGSETDQINLVPTSTSTMNRSVRQKTPPVGTVDQVGNCTQQCYIVDPYNTVMAIPHPYHAIPSSYVAAPVLVTPTPTCNEMLQNYAYERLVLPLSSQTQAPPATQVGDYFNDENTMGCHVM